jgi:hypothetical protein
MGDVYPDDALTCTVVGRLSMDLIWIKGGRLLMPGYSPGQTATDHPIPYPPAGCIVAGG